MPVDQRATLLSAVTSTGAGTEVQKFTPVSRFVTAMQVILTGSPTRAVVALEALVDGSTYSTIGTFDTANGDVSGNIILPRQVKVQNVRANLTVLTGGTAPGVSCYITASDDAGATSDANGGASASAGGLQINRLLAAANSTNATVVKASGGRLYTLDGYNAAASITYIKLYDKATAPTVGTDTPKLSIPVKATDRFSLQWPSGIDFTTGIGFGIVTGNADANTTAPAANDIVGMHVGYK